MQTLCPCGSKIEKAKCCELIVSGVKEAKTAEELMRSRYYAFTTANPTYLMQSQSVKTRKLSEKAMIKKWAASVLWTGLQVLSASLGGVNDETGYVEFRALFVEDGQLQKIHENSFFRREKGKWVYVSGEHIK